MMKIKSLFFVFTVLFSCISHSSVDKTVVLSKFLQKHRTLSNMECRLENLAQYNEPEQRIIDMFFTHVAPLLDISEKINEMLIDRNFDLSNELIDRMIQFNDLYEPYAELVKSLSVFLLQTERLYIMQQ